MNTLPNPVCQIIRGCHSYCGHPWAIHGWPQLLTIRGPSMNGTPCLTPSVKVSVDAIVTVVIHGPSMDGHSYWPSVDHPWMNTLPNPVCQSIRGCHSYCGHPWTIHGWTTVTDHPLTIYGWTHCLPPSDKVVEATVTVVIHGPSIDGPQLLTIHGPSICQSIRGCHSYRAIVTSNEVWQYTGGGN